MEKLQLQMSYKKVLYVGGQKSGKTALALKHTLKLSKKSIPNYIATYKNNFKDKSMKKRLKVHQKERINLFHTIEESKNLNKVIKSKNTYIVDCLTMWIFNNIDKKEKYFINHLNKILKKDVNIVFVLNDVNSGIIPIDKISRKFIDISGVVGRIIASKCDEVYSINYGIKIKVK